MKMIVTLIMLNAYGDDGGKSNDDDDYGKGKLVGWMNGLSVGN